MRKKDENHRQAYIRIVNEGGEKCRCGGRFEIDPRALNIRDFSGLLTEDQEELYQAELAAGAPERSVWQCNKCNATAFHPVPAMKDVLPRI